ncbi:MAG: hypothetical protein J5911_05195 [Clostridia bacterium]|nr:hypothetical protein [Clostridia bacterium]
MKNILLIGVGGTGSNAVQILNDKINEIGNLTKSNITAIVFDTDVGCVESIKSATPISMADPASVGTICDRVGREYVREWFPCDDKAVRAQEMIRGASQWRKKSYLAFLNLMNKPQARSAFIGALEDMTKDPSASCEIYIVASIAGGTGSGAFIPIALYARRYLRKQLGKNPIINAMVALPDIYADAQTEDNRIKIYANAYAILRELNAIYLVARNYNEGDRYSLKTAPVKFRIGNPNEPNVGVLFDADDRQFWTPEAAPFTQIFVLDRIPTVKSIKAHDIVLANSLYTLICTDIGVEFDSEASNHEILRSQNNGSNAIYASVSTSQMNFPVESILDYLAHEKAMEACDSEWLVLHKAAENKMREKEQECREIGNKFVAANGEYAEVMLDELKNDAEDNGGRIADLVNRGTVLYDENGQRTENHTADRYFEEIDNAIESKITDIDDTFEKFIEGFGKKKITDKQTLINDCSKIGNKLKEYYKKCIDTIRRTANSVSEAIITFDKDKDVFAKNNLSLVDGLLKDEDRKKFLHPVSAMVQLCRLSKLLNDNKAGVQKEWSDIKQRGEVSGIPEDLLAVPSSDKVKGVNHKASKSAYVMSAEGKKEYEHKRFSNFILHHADLYKGGKKRTDFAADIDYLKADIKYVRDQIRAESIEQLKAIVFKRLTDNIELLIKKYRNFFSRFEKEKEELFEDTKTAKRKDSGLIDSILNIYSSEEDKQFIKGEVFRSIGPESESSLKEADDLAGKGVFTSVYAAACAEKNANDYNEKDAASYRSLFANMVSAYKEFIKQSDKFKVIASYNVIEAMVESCKNSKENKNKSKETVFGEYFSKIQGLATPSLKIDDRIEVGDLVEPSKIIVYMISTETGKYIKRHADELKLVLPQGQIKEDTVIKACAESFIRKYSGSDSARVVIVKDIPSTVLYCTGEIMDITPLRIPKFNEISEEKENLYYQNYVKAIQNFKKYDTDMWNPHIGNNLFQRGFLPFMNMKKEELEDVKMAKALIYGLAEEKIIYSCGLSQSRDVYTFRYDDNGVKKTIKGDDDNTVTINNIVQIVNWLRREDDIVDKWSKAFDAKLEIQKHALPNVTTEAQVQRLESELTKSIFMSYFHKKLFEAKSNRITLLELAYMIKTSEEASRDCDYADRILVTSYNIFKELIAFRANPDSTPEIFVNIYHQQLDKVFASLADSEIIRAVGQDSCEDLLKQIISWCESRNTFVAEPLADEGAASLKFDLSHFDLTKAKIAEVKATLKSKEKSKAEDDNGETKSKEKSKKDK